VKIFVTLAGLAIVAVLAFQNCNKMSKAGEDGVDESQKAQATRIDIVPADISKVMFYVMAPQTVTRSGKSFSLMTRMTLSIDMQTGVLTESSDETKSRTFCPPEKMMNDMAGILGDSQVCKWGHVSSPGTMCTMALMEPYAEVAMADDMWPLGYASDGCLNNLIDLCDNRGTLLKEWVTQMSASYTSYDCR